MALRGLVLLALVVVAAGCSGASRHTKAGVGVARSLTLTMQTPDGDDPDAAYFAEQVKERTGGRIRIVVDGDTYSSVDPDNELKLVRALRSGNVALAFLPSRAWERDGLPTFRALQAPFLITNYALLRRVTLGPIGARMLRSVSRFGLIGLGLVPKELRRPLGRAPLVSPTAFRGARIRVVSSPTSVLDLRALGAVPVANLDAHETLAALVAGRLDGVESEAHSILSNSYESAAPYLVANLPLFAKAQTIVIRRDAFRRLSASERTALRAAAAATVAHANPAAQERAEIRQLCGSGLKIVEASPPSQRALRRAAAAAYESIESDPASRAAVEAIDRLAGRLAGAGATLRACPAQTPAKSATRNQTFPQGTYESRLTPADFRKGLSPWNPGFPTPWKIVIRDGRWHTNEHPPFSGRYSVRGDELTFLILTPPNHHNVREVVRWTYFRNQLTLRVVSVADSGSRVIYTAHPWRRVGS
jgi:C4-dicarboxylate-binding protein DctP